MTITDTPVNNGVNVAALLGARDALSAAPEAAEFTWRASCTWRNGTHSHSTISGFSGLGTEQQHRTTYGFDVDHPECFASEDNGATPVEFVLVGLVMDAVEIRTPDNLAGVQEGDALSFGDFTVALAEKNGLFAAALEHFRIVGELGDRLVPAPATAAAGLRRRRPLRGRASS